MDHGVIEIPSSPELAPSTPVRKPANQRRRARKPPGDVIIVLTDSEDEAPRGVVLPRVRARPATPSRSQPRGVTKSPSKSTREPQQPLFLPDPYDLEPGPSNQSEVPNRKAASPVGRVEANDREFMSLSPSRSLLDPEDEIPSGDRYVAQVLEIIPDVEPAHVLELIERFREQYKDKVVEPVLHALFENSGYPKVDKGKAKAKRKREDGDEGDERRHTKQLAVEQEVYLQKDPRRAKGVHYFEIALDQLLRDFPSVPKNHVRSRLLREGGHYAIAFFALEEDQAATPRPYRQNNHPRTDAQNKGKGVARSDPEFDQERAWLVRKLEERKVAKDPEVAAQLNEKEYEDAGAGIECGCCFTDYPFDNMVQCPDAHLFCKDCMGTYAETLLGSHDHKIICMDQSGCKLAFPESELKRFLSSKLWSLYERVKQQKEIEAAGLEGLEECPFCEYKVVIENEQERLFHCQNEDCGAVSCRACKKLDHLPKTCKEVEADKKLDAQHTVEEAMTRALMRNCPKCSKAFIKEGGCNKMTCPNCHTLSCYICRKIINGYDHFDRAPGSAHITNGKCVLWDQVEQRHADEVAEAAKQAMQELKLARPDVDEKDIHVDIPKAPPALPVPQVVPRPVLHIPPPPPAVARHVPNHRRAAVRQQRRAVVQPPPPVPQQAYPQQQLPQFQQFAPVMPQVLPQYPAMQHHHHYPQIPQLGLGAAVAQAAVPVHGYNAAPMPNMPLPMGVGGMAAGGANYQNLAAAMGARQAALLRVQAAQANLNANLQAHAARAQRAVPARRVTRATAKRG